MLKVVQVTEAHPVFQRIKRTGLLPILQNRILSHRRIPVTAFCQVALTNCSGAVNKIMGRQSFLTVKWPVYLGPDVLNVEPSVNIRFLNYIVSLLQNSLSHLVFKSLHHQACVWRFNHPSHPSLWDQSFKSLSVCKWISYRSSVQLRNLAWILRESV